MLPTEPQMRVPAPSSGFAEQHVSGLISSKCQSRFSSEHRQCRAQSISCYNDFKVDN
jgi:hypothetical protein